MDTMIKCLPKDVQGKLRSGVAIPSLQQCVEELVLNSIDAEATCVGVRMDMEAFKVQVIDNGAGIDAADMESVGKRYHTSKCSSVEDLDNLRWSGFRGEALASIASLATLVEISSRTRLSVKTHVKIFKAGKGMDVFEAATSRPSAGTTVVVCNFLHNMPVRRKRMDAVLEGERIRHRVEAISLMHPSVSFSLKNDCTGAMMVQLPKARDTYHRFVQIHSLGRAQKLGELSYTHGQFEVFGHIGREGHYNNSLQFLYVNERLLLKTQIHKLLSFLLRRLSTSNQTNDSPGGQSAIRSPKHKRSQELHGVYIINIKCSYSEYDICLEPAKTLIEFKDWDGILLCIEEAVKAFLSKENLVAVLSQDDLDTVPPESLGAHTTAQEGLDAANDSHVYSSATTLMKLSSGPVHRKRKDDCVCEENVDDECEDDAELGKQMITGNELKCEGSPNKEYTPDDNITGCQKICLASSVRQLEPSNRKEIPLTSLNSITQQIQPDLTSIEQLLPVCQGTRHEHTSGGNGKIRLSNPYIHEKLLTPDWSQTSQSVFQQQILTQKCEERFASRRKISLEAGCDRTDQKQCKDIIPSKIPRISTSQKLSLCEESGSLDKFRRICVKSDELTHQDNNTRLPPTDGCVSNSHNLLEEKDETCSSFRSKPTLSKFTKLKPVSGQTRGKTSLAAKLCHLKQHRTDQSVLPHLSRTTSQGSPSSQDRNNNEDPCDTALNPLLAEQEETTSSGDWLHHYDASVGKTVYINKVTGLSRYEDLPAEETQVCCTSDVTNMAVSVISEMDVESSNSLTSLYTKWKNPVFIRPPTVGVDISSGQADGLAVKIHNILFPYRFSKAMIHSMKVIHQVDKKFLACLINTRDEEPAALTETEGNLLVLVDQHAAHERVRLENLIADSYEDDPHAPGERRLCASSIVPPLEISVTEEEQRLLRSCQAHLRSLGLGVKFSEAEDLQVYVGKVPLCFMEKESNELRRGRPSVIKPVVEEYLREQIELLRSTGRMRGTLPLTVLKVLASLACHGAIKFNDSLSRDECCSLVASLSSCQLPFQCAHGRPSIAPLVDTLHLDKDDKEVQKPNLQKLRRMQRAWELYGNR